ncbi:MAG: CPBP family intramembrane metalloprotease [Defluviitaleaceae bacterium]|nr:CPBP family intramembrane metalloprotease [Defluviitaleaceae bacterium]
MAHRRGLVFMLYILVFFLVGSALFGRLLPLFNDADSPLVMLVYQVLTLLVPLGLWLLFFREGINLHLPHIRLGTTNLIYIVGLSIFLQPAMSALSLVGSLFFPNLVAELLLEKADYPLALLIMGMAVTPAICEEVVFRGYFQSTFKEKPLAVMLLLNGLFFGILHFNPQQFLYAFAMGIFFAYIVHLTKSIRAAIISHFIVNASQVSLMVFLSRYMDTHTEEMEIVVEGLENTEIMEIIQYSLLGAILLVSSIFAGFIFYYFRQHNLERFALWGKEGVGEEVIAEATQEEAERGEVVLEETGQTASKKFALLDYALILAIVALYVFVVSGIH